MKFVETELAGALVIEIQRIGDSRGFFARTFCRREFEAHGLNADLVQCSVSFNNLKGTIRGMHYQKGPYAEAKLVRCIRGAIYDVILDLRPQSPTFMRWLAIELSADNQVMLYVPEGFAHGFQTLRDESEVLYQISEFYSPEHACGIRWNDPAFAIKWPIPNPVMSARDQNHPEFAA